MYETVTGKGNNFKDIREDNYQRVTPLSDRCPGALLAGNWGPQDSSDGVSDIQQETGTRSILSPPLSPREGGPGGQGASLDRTRLIKTSSWDPEIFKPKERGYPATEGFNFSDDNFKIEPADVPGSGFVQDGCGQWVRKLKSGDQVRDILHSCDRLSCPRCLDATITKKAHEASERFEHYEAAKISADAVLIPGEFRRAVSRHIPFTISPGHAAELWHQAGRTHPGFVKLARNEFNHILRSIGLVGCVAVYHANRVRHPATGLTGKKAKELIIREAKLAGAMKDDSPSWMMYAYISKQKNRREYYYFSPHFHVVGFGTLPGHEDFEAAFPGWSYHNKGNVPNVGGLLRYLFSHQAMIEGCQAVTWHGRLSRVTLGTEELRTIEKPVICEGTGLPWVIIESVILGEIGRTYTENVTEYRAFFRTKIPRGPPDPFRMRTRKAGPRSSCPDWVRDKGILAMASYCDEYGRL